MRRSGGSGLPPATTVPRRPATRTLLLRLSWLLFALGLLRLAVVVFNSPIVGYADNYDFVRPAVCTGLWQMDGFTPGKEAVPVNRLHNSGARSASICLRSADNAWMHLVARLSPQDAVVDYRWLGGLRLAFAVAVQLALLALCRLPGLHAALNGAWLLGVADITVSPYFNSLYQEASLLVGVAACIGTCAVASTVAAHRRWQAAAFGVAAVAWTAWTKQQYLPFALCIGAVLVGIAGLSWRSTRHAVAIAAAVAVAGLVALRMNDADRPVVRDIRLANATNAFFGAVLPEARDPAAAAATLGLPAHCATSVGQDWYTPGYAQRNPCPEVGRTSRAALLPLFVREPATFWRPLARAADLARPFYPTQVGLFERPADAQGLRAAALRATSLPHAVSQLGSAYRLVVWGSVLLGLAACGAAAVATARRWHDAADCRVASLWLVGLGGATVLYALASSVFGDGYFDFGKHASGSVIGFACQAAGLLLLAGSAFSHRMAARKPGQRA